MKQFVCKPTIHMFPTCKDFLAGFDIGEEDLVLSNAYIFKPFFDGLDCRAKALFLEDYGQGEPSDTMVDALLAAASRYDFRRIIAIGGGSVIDVAKVLAVAPAGSDTSAVFDCKELKQEKELIILPTTCGTGSEVTNISIINRTCLGIKVGLVHDSLYARHAVLVPELLEKLPYPVFATSSLDALVHAVESYLSTAAPLPACSPRKPSGSSWPATRTWPCTAGTACAPALATSCWRAPMPGLPLVRQDAPPCMP